MSAVSFQKVTKSFGTTAVVHELDIELPENSFTVLVGPSGCGKTTTLRMLAGLEETTSGAILIDGRDVTHLEPRDRDIAMVFQNYALYPHLTVRENLAFPLRAQKRPKSEVNALVDEVAESLGLTRYLARRPKELSGGQQQRVAIGRAIVRKPAVFLFDEPLSNLDAKLRLEMRTELLRLQRRLGTTVLYVTHDQEEAMTLSDWIIVMRDGVIAQQGTPAEIYSRPESAFVAAFVGSPTINLIDGEDVDGSFVSVGGVVLDVGPLHAPRITAGIRPEDLILTRTEPGETGGAAGTIELIELLGPRAIVAVSARGERWTSVVAATQLEDLREGDAIRMSVRPGAVHQFSPETGERLERVAASAAS